MDLYAMTFDYGVKVDYANWLPPVPPHKGLKDPVKIEEYLAKKEAARVEEAPNGILTGSVISATLVSQRGDVFDDVRRGVDIAKALVEELFGEVGNPPVPTLVFGFNIRTRIRQIVADLLSESVPVDLRLLSALNYESDVRFYDPRKFLFGTDTISIQTFRDFLGCDSFKADDEDARHKAAQQLMNVMRTRVNWQP